MEEKCSLCARSEISSAGAAPARIAAAIKPQTVQQNDYAVRRILPPVQVIVHGHHSPALSGAPFGNPSIKLTCGHSCVPRRHSWLLQVRRKAFVLGVHTIVNTA